MLLGRVILPALLACSIGGCQEVIRIDPLEKGEALEGGGMCFYTIKPTGSDSPQAMTVDDNTNEWLIRINGKLHRLKPLSERKSERRKGKSSVGDSYRITCADSKVTVFLRCKVTAVGYENTHFEGKLTVRLGSSSKTFDITGDNGC